MALDEPFIQEEDGWTVADGPSDGVQDTLGEDEVRNVLRERTQSDANTHDDLSDEESFPSQAGPLLEDCKHNRRPEVHDARCAGANDGDVV
jgi:hypothetical protein